MSIEVRHLSFSYGSRQVLRDVSFSVGKGRLLSVLGPNGVGKSTLFRCILGLLHGFQGEITVDGTAVSTLGARELARKVAYIPQSNYPAFQYSVFDMVLMGTTAQSRGFSPPGPKQEAAALEALERLDISHLADRSYTRLSGGERQLVLIARALAQQAKILLMDEPTSSLDFGNRIRVLDQTAELARRGYAILLSCHDPQLALLYAHRAAALHQGKILADGPPGEVLNEALLHTLYQVPVRFTPTQYGTLLSPVRQHHYHWTEERVAYMEAAAERSDFYERIAQAVADAVPADAVVCDAGCGLGFASLALAPRFRRVVAADRSPEALAALRRRNTFPNLDIQAGDLFSQPPAEPYDAMLFCFFGSAEEILRCARQQCRGTVVAVKPAWTRHRFSRSAGTDRRHGAGALEDLLTAGGIPYTRRELDLRLDQPLRSVDDGVRFFRLYSRDADPAAITEDFVRARLEPQEDPDYPFRLPVERKVVVLTFDAKDIPQEMKGD